MMNIDFIQDGCTALMLACKEGHVAAVQFLLSKEADVNLKKNVRYKGYNV